MSKRVSFVDKDIELVERISEFQKQKGLPSFIEAIRVLCNNGLHVNEIVKNNK